MLSAVVTTSVTGIEEKVVYLTLSDWIVLSAVVPTADTGIDVIAGKKRVYT